MKIPVHVISLGCPKNLVDTEKMIGAYSDKIELCQHPEEAQIILINTCSFIQPAVEESVSTILNIAYEIKDYPNKPILVVTGCLVERFGKEELKKEIPEVDFWIAIHEQNQWLNIVCGYKKYDIKGSRLITTPKSYAYLKISEGCDHKCSFCLIPSIRGNLISREIEEIKKDLKDIISRGTKEVILVAQDVVSYGKDKGKKNAFKYLLEEIVKFDIKWLRLLYIHPSGINKNFLGFLKNIQPPFLPYFDVPLQHSHPEILKKMNRPPNSTYKIELIKEFFPEACIRTSFIVGFPEETEKHFNHLLKFVEMAKFNHMGVFEYIHEEGTLCSKVYKNDIDNATKEKRKSELMELQKGISREILKRYKSKEMEVLVDRPSNQWPNLFIGRSWFQAPDIDGITYISSLKQNPVGNIIKVEIQDSYEYDLSGLEII